MKLRVLTVSVLFFLQISWSTELEKRSCEYPEYNGVVHTICLAGDAPSKPSPLTDAEKTQLLNDHNSRRGSGLTTSGSDLQKMVWDDELEKSADAFIRLSLTQHDYNRYHPTYKENSGQNIAMHSGDVMAYAIPAWWDVEQLNFTYGVASNLTYHFTQMAQSRAVKLGCAKGHYNNANYLVCNYITGNANAETPYSLGAAASACAAEYRVSGVCDCSGKYCGNGGSMDLSTCTCNCPAEYSGDECLQQSICDGITCYQSEHGCVNHDGPFYTASQCGEPDMSWCPTWSCSALCSGPYRAYCPITCALCKELAACEEPDCFTSPQGCKNWNRQISAADCALYAPGGVDPSWCAQYGCAQCASPYAIYCPYMCAYCS